jgi:hypothetical protein
MQIVILSATPEYREASVALLERYLRLPDAWPRGTPMRCLPPIEDSSLTFLAALPRPRATW